MLGKKKNTLALVVGLLAALAPAGAASAQTAGMLGFQGLIKDLGGVPINSPVDLTFTIYDAETDGNAVAGPFGPYNVSPINGVVSTKFGPVLPSAFDGGQRWLEVSIDGSPLSRIEMATAPATSEQVNKPGTGESAIHVDGEGKVGIGTTTPEAALHVEGSEANCLKITVGGTAMSLDGNEIDGFSGIWLNANTNENVYLAYGGGKVGIGTTNPAAALHVVGSEANCLKITQGDTSMSLDGNEIDGFSGIWLNANTNENVNLAYGGGNVAIGDVQPLSHLSVAGDIAAESGHVWMSVNTGNAGYFETRGGAGSQNVLITTPMGYPDNGYVAVANSASDLRAGMYVDSSGSGVVFGDVKSFRMPNPNKRGTEIWYASLEGPEAAAYVRGTARLVNGEATINLPDHFRAVAAEQGMTVQLTPLSADSLGLAVTRKGLDSVVVKELHRGTGDYDFDFIVTAVRKGHEDYRVIRPASEAAPATSGASRARDNPYYGGSTACSGVATKAEQQVGG